MGDAVRAGAKAGRAQREVEQLADRLDRLQLVCTAMWELLAERAELTEQDLLAKVEEVDLRDGRADGKISPQVKRCRQCGRAMSQRHARCLYCGAAKLDSGAFDQV